MAWHKRWLDRAMQDPAPDAQKAASNARMALGTSLWATMGLVAVFLVVSVLRWFVFEDDDAQPFDLFGFLGLMFALQAFALIGRETYHRKLLEERVAALEENR